MPGKTSGSEAILSSSQRPGSFVFTTSQQITEVTSMTTVAVPNDGPGIGVRVVADRVERATLRRTEMTAS